MSLASPDLQDTSLADDDCGVSVLAPRDYQDQAVAAYEDAELLLTAILPDARIAHMGASAVPGAYSRGNIDVCVAVSSDSFDEAFGVLVEAGFVMRPHGSTTGRLRVLDAPDSALPLALRLIESASRHESLIGFRDALRGNAELLARYNAVRIAAAPAGTAAYATAKTQFIESVVGR
jgi:GrpB-like predicted nucleotidyltransferase (UPF0157 family)